MAAIDPAIRKLKNEINAFRISALVFLVSLILLFALSSSYLTNSLSSAVMLAVFVSALMYNIYLGILASRTQSSVVTWVGLNIILSPFSYLYTYINMLNKAKQKLRELVEIRESYEQPYQI